MKPLTVKELGKILWEEFKEGYWGEVDPDAFSDPPKRTDTDSDYEEALGLHEVLERVVARLNARK